MPPSSSASSSCVVPTSSVPRPRWLCVAIGTSSRIRSTSSAVAGLLEPLGGPSADEVLRARAGVDPRRLDPDHAPRALGACGRDADQRDHLLGLEAGHRRAAPLRPAGDDAHLGPQGVLALDDLRRDPVGEHLHEQALAEDDLVDRLVEELGEARHVDALLVAREVDGAVDLRRHQDLVVAAADPDRLVHAGDARARESEPDGRRGRLHVANEREVAHAGHATPRATTRAGTRAACVERLRALERGKMRDTGKLVSSAPGMSSARRRAMRRKSRWSSAPTRTSVGCVTSPRRARRLGVSQPPAAAGLSWSRAARCISNTRRRMPSARRPRRGWARRATS